MEIWDRTRQHDWRVSAVHRTRGEWPVHRSETELMDLLWRRAARFSVPTAAKLPCSWIRWNMVGDGIGRFLRGQLARYGNTGHRRGLFRSCGLPAPGRCMGQCHLEKQ